MLLYHTGYQEIRTPDIHRGRKNADFGQGFYLTDDAEFACRWARERKDSDVILNTYKFDPEGLQICRFEREQVWFEYIFSNRRGKPDQYPQSDVIIGPIANDTIYDTFGIITSGFLSDEQAMRLLMPGPVYRQIVLKTDRAVAHLTWIGARKLEKEEISRYRTIVAEEEADFQRQFAQEMERF